MRTFNDWLQYYNNLDVMPGLEALEKMRAFYVKKGIDILKDAVSIPSISMHTCCALPQSQCHEDLQPRAR